MNSHQSSSHLLSVLSIWSFRNLWLAQVISQIAWNMLIFVLGILVYQSSRSNSSVSLLYFTVGVPATITGFVSGVFIDHFDKKKILLTTTFLRALLIITIFFVKTYSIWVYVLTAVVSVLSQFFVPAEASLIPTFVSKKLILPANSLFTLTFYSAIIGGFVVGGPLLAYVGIDKLLWLLAGFFILSAVFLFFLPDQKTATSQSQLGISHIKQDIESAFAYLKEAHLVRNAILLITFSQAVIAIFMTLGPGFADKILEIRITDASLIILGPAAIGMIVGALLVSQLGTRFRKRTLIEFSIFMSGYLLLFLSVLTRNHYYNFAKSGISGRLLNAFDNHLLPLVISCFFLLGLAQGMIDVASNAVIQERTPGEIRGRIYGILASLISGVAILPVLLSGVLADFFGIGKIIFGLGIFLVSFGIYATGRLRRLSQS